MNNLKKKAAYVKGLMEGMELDENKKETKLFSAIVDLLDEMASGVCELNQDIDDVCEEIDAIDESVAGLEDEIYGQDDRCRCDEDCDCGCQDGDESDDIFYEVTCPACNQKMQFDEKTLLNEKTNCINCGELLEFDLTDTCHCDCEDKN